MSLAKDKYVYVRQKLTAYENVYWIADVRIEIIGHMTAVWSLIISGHINYSQNGSSFSCADLNSVTGCDLKAAVHPEERRRWSRAGAEKTDRVLKLNQVQSVWFHHNIGDTCCGSKWDFCFYQSLKKGNDKSKILTSNYNSGIFPPICIISHQCDKVSNV